jgi:hypothetical protein
MPAMPCAAWCVWRSCPSGPHSCCSLVLPRRRGGGPGSGWWSLPALGPGVHFELELRAERPVAGCPQHGGLHQAGLVALLPPPPRRPLSLCAGLLQPGPTARVAAYSGSSSTGVDDPAYTDGPAVDTSADTSASLTQITHLVSAPQPQTSPKPLLGRAGPTLGGGQHRGPWRKRAHLAWAGAWCARGKGRGRWRGPRVAGPPAACGPAAACGALGSACPPPAACCAMPLLGGRR